MSLQKNMEDTKKKVKSMTRIIDVTSLKFIREKKGGMKNGS